MESRFLEPSVSRTSRYFEPILVSLGFASLKLYNFTPRFLEPSNSRNSDNSNQFWLPWGKLTLDNSNLPKISNHLVRMSITNWAPRVPGTFLKSQTRVSRLQRGNKLLQIFATKLSERYILTLHDMCSVMFHFCFCLSTFCL